MRETWQPWSNLFIGNLETGCCKTWYTLWSTLWYATKNFTDQTGDWFYTESWTLIYIYQTGHNMGSFTRDHFGYNLSITDSFVYE